MTPSLLIIWHSRTGASEAMAKAAYEGAKGEGSSSVRLLECHDAQEEDLAGAGGFIFACPENLGTMSGAMKEMFDRNYYPLLGKIEGRPFASLIAAGSDGSGAQRQLDRIVTGWRLKRVAEPLIVNLAADTPEAIMAPKTLPPKAAAQCREIGAGLAAGLAMGVF